MKTRFFINGSVYKYLYQVFLNASKRIANDPFYFFVLLGVAFIIVFYMINICYGRTWNNCEENDLNVPSLLRQTKSNAQGGICRGDCRLGDLRENYKYNDNNEITPINGAIRVVNRRLDNGLATMDKGSGVVITDAIGDYYVLTAAHIFKDGIGRVSIQLQDGSSASPQFLWKSDEADVALLKIVTVGGSNIKRTPTFEIAKNYPNAGEFLYICGYGPNEVYKTFKGKLLGYVQTSERSAFETLKVECVVRQGDSGGPVFNSDRKIVGLVWGTDGTHSYAVYCERIIAEIQMRIPRFFYNPDLVNPRDKTIKNRDNDGRENDSEKPLIAPNKDKTVAIYRHIACLYGICLLTVLAFLRLVVRKTRTTTV